MTFDMIQASMPAQSVALAMLLALTVFPLLLPVPLVIERMLWVRSWACLLAIAVLSALVFVMVPAPAWATPLVAVITMVLPAMLIITLVVGVVASMRRDGVRPSNILTLLMTLLFGLAVATVPLLVAGRATVREWRMAGLLYMPLIAAGYSFIMFIIGSVSRRRMPERRTYDAIVIHGCSIHGDEPSPLLKERLDKAIEAWERYGEPYIIASGGKGTDKQISEAECMRRYLVEHGVPDSRILVENRSENTWKNIEYSDRIARERLIPHDAPYRLLLVTSDYHTMRCAWYAGNQHVPCDVVGSRTDRLHWPTVGMREFAAVTRDNIAGYMAIMLMYMLIDLIDSYVYFIGQMPF